MQRRLQNIATEMLLPCCPSLQSESDTKEIQKSEVAEEGGGGGEEEAEEEKENKMHGRGRDKEDRLFAQSRNLSVSYYNLAKNFLE